MRLSHFQSLIGAASDIKRLYLLNVIERNHSSLESCTHARMARQRWLMAIKDFAEDGKIALVQWQRDCDHCEGTSRYLLDADVRTVDEFCEKQYSYAEGPMHFSIQRPSDPFEPYHRDRVAEAFDNQEYYRV